MNIEHLPSLTRIWPSDHVELEDEDVDVEIVAVHGLGANPATTWTSNNGVNWLSDPNMLSKSIPRSRVWTFNFLSDWKGPAPLQNLDSLANQLLQFLFQFLPNTATSIVFVGHSFGGIVVANALSMPPLDDRHTQLLESVKGALFLGTPFRGTGKASFARIFGRAWSAFGYFDSRTSKHLLKDLRKGNKNLRKLIDNFAAAAQSKQWSLTCVFEQKPTAFFKNKLGRLGNAFSTIIVPEKQAVLDGHLKLGINASHTEMNEFGDCLDGNYQLVSAHILNIARTTTCSRHIYAFCTQFLVDEDFVGRVDILEEIRHRLRFKPNLQPRLALYGIGGIGKTSIVTSYAYSIKNSLAHRQTSLFSVNAGTQDVFIESYRDLARLFKIRLPMTSTEDNLRTVTEYLAAKENGKWIMILENADDIELFTPPFSLKDYIPRCDHGALLITSRYRNICTKLAGAKEILQVDLMNHQESRDFLEKQLSKTALDNENAITELISNLDGIPLALKQATAYMNQNFQSVSQYLNLWPDGGKKMLGLEDGGNVLDVQQKANNRITTTWKISFAQIIKISPSAFNILSVMGYYYRQDIPKYILPRDDYTSSLASFEEALGVLRSYSMITLNRRRDSFNIHALIQLSIREYLQEDPDQFLWLNEAMWIIEVWFNRPMADRKGTCCRLLSHARSVVEFSHALDAPLVWTKEIPIWAECQPSEVSTFNAIKMSEVRTLLQLAELAIRRQKYSEADELQTQALEISQLLFIDTYMKSDEIRYLRGMMYLERGNFEDPMWINKANEEFWAIFQHYKSLNFDPPPDLVNIFPSVNYIWDFKLGRETSLYMMLKSLQSSEACGLEAADKRFCEDQVEYTKAVINIGWFDTLCEAVAYVEEHLELEDYISNISALIQHEASEILRYTAAVLAFDVHRSMNEVLLEILQVLLSNDTFGPDHPQTLSIMTEIVRAYILDNDIDKAEKMGLEVYRRRKRIFGEDHPDTIDSFLEYAKLDHPDIISTLVNEEHITPTYYSFERYIDIIEYKRRQDLEYDYKPPSNYGKRTEISVSNEKQLHADEDD